MKRLTSLTFAMVLLAVSVSGCATYQFGNQFMFRNDVRSVHVAMFDTNSYRRFLGQRLTEAVIREVELSTPYRIAEPGNADSIIRGKIVRDQKRSQGNNRFDEPRDIQVAYRVEVTWTDRAGNPLMAVQSLRIDDDENFIPEGGQSVTTAQQNLINKIAREVVGQMEMPW